MSSSYDRDIAAIALRVATHPLYPQLQTAFYDKGGCHIDIEIWVVRLCNNHPIPELPDELDDFIEQQINLRILASDPWHNVPRYEAEDWKDEVANGDTRLGYSEWVEHKMEDTE